MLPVDIQNIIFSKMDKKKTQSGCTSFLTETINKIFDHRFANIFLLLELNICVLGAPKNRLIETVLLSTHNICFG